MTLQFTMFDRVTDTHLEARTLTEAGLRLLDGDEWGEDAGEPKPSQDRPASMAAGMALCIPFLTVTGLLYSLLK